MDVQRVKRSIVLKDSVVFQIKLSIDAIRACFLSPASILCAFFDCLVSPPEHQSLYYRLMKLGHKSESWINVFGSRNINEELSEDQIDSALTTIKEIIKDPKRADELTRSAHKSINQLLHSIHNINK